MPPQVHAGAAIRGSVAAFVPELAAQDFPKNQFAVVNLDGINCLGRKLYLVHEPTTSSLRPVARAQGKKAIAPYRSRDGTGWRTQGAKAFE
jgi:hypothetical protein